MFNTLIPKIKKFVKFKNAENRTKTLLPGTPKTWEKYSHYAQLCMFFTQFAFKIYRFVSTC